ncbi:MAG: hypothetical protein HRT71_21765 [Flavobacteriales bacterium]|nr:hypothetical protein [Flavobacteriales bacterium]
MAAIRAKHGVKERQVVSKPEPHKPVPQEKPPVPAKKAGEKENQRKHDPNVKSPRDQHNLSTKRARFILADTSERKR